MSSDFTACKRTLEVPQGRIDKIISCRPSGSQELALADLARSLGHIHHFTLHPCHWTNHPHRVLKRFIETKVPPGTPDAVMAQTGTGKKKKETSV
jgi:hypothetical protein